MSVTSGFYNSLNGDRKYTAEQFSALYDGVINDGVFANIGTAFSVTANSGNNVVVGSGRAWFNHSWIYNDSTLVMAFEEAESLLDRIDAVVIDVNHTQEVRKGDIMVVKGKPASTPENPTLFNSEYHAQYPLAYIYRKAGSKEITQANIINKVGTSDCPYVTGILQVQNIDNIVAQWEAQWKEWSANWSAWENAWDVWYGEESKDAEYDVSMLLAQMKSDFDTWFADLQTLLDGDVAANLAEKVLELEERFHLLATENMIIDPLEDSNGESLLDSSDNIIFGKSIIGSDDGNPNIEADLDMDNYKIINLKDPVENTDAANKKYVDAALTDVVFKGEYYNDMNSLVETGIYRVGTNDNLPESIWYGQVVVMRGKNSDTVGQMGMGYTDGRVTSRTGRIVDGEWIFSEWGTGYSTTNKPTPAEIGAAPATHGHTSDEISGNFAAGKIVAGTFASTAVKAANGTDYTTPRIRNTYANITAMTAGSSNLANGDIYLQYE